ncbi:thioredoxin peroxidase [Chlorella sorokiniana]|uniref:Thioredoxin peroxidase n=1 Tax=Chlorella sorokiniana TaxID=3076 RepID=A0A2P6TVX4_CHLSO|nr:thioredoxin peroxidase [Chlorella sorokiniana]|eukprot:PRW58213.1 thioredoxin peroxidase [Chlorella sorokiniana]
MTSKVSRGFMGMFSKATPAADASKLKPGVALPHGGRVEIGAPTGRWQLVVVYRGKHDPLCVTYLAALQVAYGLNEEQMRRWGLYISRPLGPEESINLFSEPALFLVNPAGLLHVMVYSNASFARPDLKQIAQGIKMVQDRKQPIRGTFY